MNALYLLTNIIEHSIEDALAVVKIDGIIYSLLEFCQCPDYEFRREAFYTFNALFVCFKEHKQYEVAAILPTVQCRKRGWNLLEICVSNLNAKTKQFKLELQIIALVSTILDIVPSLCEIFDQIEGVDAMLEAQTSE